MSNQQLSVTGTAYMPVMGIEDAIQRRDAIVSFTRKVMTPDVDFGTVGGVGKPTLLKPGAEKLCTLFGLTPTFEILESELDWTGARHNSEPFFYFFYRCKMWRGETLIAMGDGSCNSMEKKYRYRWVGVEELPAGIDPTTLKKQSSKISEFTFSLNKRDTGGKYGKPEIYWQQFDEAIANKAAKMVKKTTKEGKQFDAWEVESVVYRVPNPDVADQVNTIQKMAQKRGLIAATLIAVNASEFFTQDMEDFAIDPDGALEGSFVLRTSAPAEDKGEKKDEQRKPTTEQKDEGKIEYKPLTAQDKAKVSSLIDRFAKLGAEAKSIRKAGVTDEAKSAFAAKFQDFIAEVNTQLTLRGFENVKARLIGEAAEEVQGKLNALMAFDTNAPTIKAQPELA